MAFENNKPATFVYLRFGKDAFEKDTGKARLFKDGNKPIWIPNSQVRKTKDNQTGNLIDDFYTDGDDVVIVVAEWLVTKNELTDHICPQWVEAGMPD